MIYYIYDNILPVMYWTPKMHKTPIGKRFIIASKKCSTKKKAVSSIFKLIYNQILIFHKNAKFLSIYNKFWVLQNVDPVLEKLKAINKRNKPSCGVRRVCFCPKMANFGTDSTQNV